MRKTAAAKLAEAGGGEFMLMSVMGWINPNQARKYIEKASRAKMAGKAMQMLDEEQICSKVAQAFAKSGTKIIYLGKSIFKIWVVTPTGLEPVFPP